MKKLYAAIAALGLGVIFPCAAAEINVIMSGLDNPRGLALGRTAAFTLPRPAAAATAPGSSAEKEWR